MTEAFLWLALFAVVAVGYTAGALMFMSRVVKPTLGRWADDGGIPRYFLGQVLGKIVALLWPLTWPVFALYQRRQHGRPAPTPDTTA